MNNDDRESLQEAKAEYKAWENSLEGVAYWLGDLPFGESLETVTIQAVHRLPDAITLPAYPLALLALAGCSAAVGAWAALGRAALAGVVVLLAFVGLSWATPGSAGFALGAVKPAGVLLLRLPF